MYCKRCGTNIPEKARFCPKCGETVSVNAAKKKKSHKVVALILSIVLVIGACSGVFAFREEVLSLIFGSKDVYLEVDGVLQEKIVCEEFQNASFDDRKAIAYETLSYLAKDGKIKEDSITYGENECFYFNYIDGGEGLIALYDKSNEIDGYEIFQDSVYYLNDDEIYSTIDKSGYRYSNENLKAVIVDCLGDTGEEILTDDGKSIRDVLKEDVKAWNANTMETDYYYECSIDDFKTILCGYDFIDIRCHGGTDKKGDPTIVVNESDGMFNQKYTDDVKAGRVGRSCGAFGGNYYMKNSFFSYYYNDKLNSSIIWIGCCSGYKNDVLVSTFANCGAKAVIAATDAVISGYGTVMTDAFVNGLLRCENVEDSLKFAKEKWGDNDKEKIYPNKKDNPAEFKLYDGSYEKLTDIVLKNSKGSIGDSDENNTNINLPDNYVSYGESCYFLFDTGITSWEEAESYCESLGGHLAIISNKEENNFLFNYIKQCGYKSAYFGYSDSLEEGTWTWVDGENSSYENWSTNEPNHENANEDYAMFYYKYTDGAWNDGDFGNKTNGGGRAFICEWNMNS